MTFDVTFSTNIPYNDPKYNSISLMIGGELKVDSSDPFLAFPVSEQTKQLVASTANLAIANAFMNYQQVGYLEIAGNLLPVINAVADALRARNFYLVGASIHQFMPDEASARRIEQIDSMNQILANPQAIASKMAEAQAAAEKSISAAESPAPAVPVSLAPAAASVPAPVSAPAFAAVSAPAAAPAAPVAAPAAPSFVPASPVAAPAAPVTAAAPAPVATASPAPAQPQLMRYCIRCGTLASGSKFCTNCGSSLIRKN